MDFAGHVAVNRSELSPLADRIGSFVNIYQGRCIVGKKGHLDYTVYARVKRERETGKKLLGKNGSTARLGIIDYGSVSCVSNCDA